MSEPQTRESVLTPSRTVVDPELQRDVVSLGLVKDLTVDGGRVSATLELMTHGSPYAGSCEIRWWRPFARCPVSPTPRSH
jgi:ATP-binding protein involved in chromosome partitioning